MPGMHFQDLPASLHCYGSWEAITIFELLLLVGISTFILDNSSGL